MDTFIDIDNEISKSINALKVEISEVFAINIEFKDRKQGKVTVESI